MIVFGHNSFLLHSCKPSQIGMPEDLDKEYIIERRQRYFHLFWIPTFGIGKIWGMRSRKNNELYEPSALVEQALNALPFQDKTPWYTYSLLLIALAAAVVVPIFISISDYLSQQRSAEYEAAKNAKYKESVLKPSNHQYFELEDEHYKNVYLKLLSQNAKSLTCLKKIQETRSYSNNEMLEAFADSTAKFDTVTIAKTDLAKCIGGRYPVLGDGANYEIDDVKVYDYPVFVMSTSGYENGEYFALLQNIGANARYVDFQPDNSNVVLKPVQTTIKARKFFTIEGKYAGMEPNLRGKMTFLNDENVKFVYNVYAFSSRISFDLDK